MTENTITPVLRLMNSKHINVRGLYVHVPFCDGKCFYCAFYSLPYESALAARYLRALEIELKEFPRLQPDTIYFGGGTPSQLSTTELQSLCRLIKENISTAALKEWTVECNPRSLTAEKLSLLARAGVNRVSLGAQAFDDTALKWLGRRHNAADIYEAARMIKSGGIKNFGLDLIACVPGLKPDAWRKTLEKAVALEPKHISVYALTAEEGSRLARAVVGKQDRPMAAENCSRPRRGRPARQSSFSTGGSGVVAPGYSAAHPKYQVNLLSEDDELEALDLAENILTAAGYARYEISNYARSGFECQHNLSCWRGEEYIGLGPAAASHVGLKRWTNLPDLGKYLGAIEHGENPPRAVDVLNKKLKQTEMIVFGLRLAEGVSKADAKPCGNALRELRKAGLVELARDRWRLTKRGLYLADYVGAEILAGRNAE